MLTFVPTEVDTAREFELVVDLIVVVRDETYPSVVVFGYGHGKKRALGAILVDILNLAEVECAIGFAEGGVEVTLAGTVP